MIKYILLKDVLKQTKCENYKQREIWMWNKSDSELRKEKKEVNGSHSLIVVWIHIHTQKNSFSKKFHLMHNTCMQTPIGS